MPNAKNFPTDYDDYLILAETSTKKEALLLLNRFAFRYRFEVPPVFRLPRGGVHATSFSFC